jgi:hypothetical protein
MSKIVYLFDANGIFTSNYVAQSDPKEPGKFIEPTDSTDILPPQTQERQAAVFNRADSSWKVESDYRGQVMFNQVDGSTAIVEVVGELSEGWALTPPPTPPMTAEQLQAAVTVAIQAALDELAQTRGYDSIGSACTYAAPTAVVSEDDPTFALCEKFRVEGNALQVYRAKVWAQSYAYLNTVAAGTVPMPTPEEAVTMMPQFAWPR